MHIFPILSDELVGYSTTGFISFFLTTDERKVRANRLQPTSSLPLVDYTLRH